MRILLVLEACGGGTGRHVIDLARGLLARGHEVMLYYSPDRAEDSFLDAIGTLKNLEKREVSINRSITPGDLFACLRIRRYIKKDGPFDVMHGHSSKGGALLRLARFGRSSSVVYTPHAPITMDPDLSGLGRYAYGAIERLLASLCRRIICVSPLERSHLLEVGLPDRKLRVVCNGIGPAMSDNRSEVRDRLGLDEQVVCLGMVGRLCHQKAPERALHALAQLGEVAEQCHLVIVGDGPDRPALESLAEDLDITGHVSFTGAVSGVEMMPAFDVMLLPSRYEGMPYVLLEAVAHALPVIMTDVGGAHLVIRNGINGIVLTDAETETFAANLSRVVEQNDLRQNMSEQAAEIAAEFSLDNMVDATLDVYRETART